MDSCCRVNIGPGFLSRTVTYCFVAIFDITKGWLLFPKMKAVNEVKDVSK